MYSNYYKILCAFLFIALAVTCTKDRKPTEGATNRVDLKTSAIVSIGSDSAISGGEIISDGGDPISERGVCWGTTSNPIVSPNSTKNGSGTGTYLSILRNLIPNTTYYVRAYIINAQGTIYGNQLSFKTKVGLPIIQTNAATSITRTSAATGGSNINAGGSAITQKGICWSPTNLNPTITNNVVLSGSGTANFSIIIQNILPNTTYYARAFATNAVGTGYGNSIQFKTLSAQLPTLITNTVTNITQTSANSGGNISDDGGATVTQRGICWSTSSNPTIANTRTFDGSGTGSFSSQMTGLQANRTYYVRSYATNSVGTAYGSQVLFTTLTYQLPSVTTSSIFNITRISAQGGGSVTNDGGYAVTQRGVCWSTSQNPTISNTRTINGSGTGSFSSSVTGLLSGRTYYIRAYATNILGTSYGSQISFRTLN